MENQYSKNIINWLLDTMNGYSMPGNIVDYYILIKNQFIDEKRVNNDVLVDIEEEVGFIIRANSFNPIEVNKFSRLTQKFINNSQNYMCNNHNQMKYNNYLVNQLKGKGDCYIINYNNDCDKYINGFFYRHIGYSKNKNLDNDKIKLIRKMEDATSKIVNLDLLKKEILNDIIVMYLLTVINSSKIQNSKINKQSMQIIRLAQYGSRDIEIYIKLLIATIKEIGISFNINSDKNIKKWEFELRNIGTIKESIIYFQEKKENALKYGI